MKDDTWEISFRLKDPNFESGVVETEVIASDSADDASANADAAVEEVTE